MAGTTAYPGALDDNDNLDETLTDGTDTIAAAHQNNQNAAIKAGQSKLGITASTATSGKILVGGSSAGTSEWQAVSGDASLASTGAITVTDNSHAHNATTMTGLGNWKLVYTNGSGAATELALGASGTVLTGGGTSSAPTFAAAAGGGGQWELIASDVGTTISTTGGTATAVVKEFDSLSVPATTPMKMVFQAHFDADGTSQNMSVNAFKELNDTETGGTGAYLQATTTADNERFFWVECIIGGRESADTNWRGYQHAMLYGGTYHNGVNYYGIKPQYNGGGPDMGGTIVVDTVTKVGLGIGTQGAHSDIRNIYLYKMIVA
jgi:hypothetical protein